MRLHQPAAVIVALLLFGGATVASAQGLGTLAKKAEDNRKAAKKGTKTYTNADAGNVPAATVTAPAAGEKPAATPPAAAGDKPAATTPPASGAPSADQAKDQAYWAQRMKMLQTQLQRDTSFRAALQTQINSLTTDFVNRDDPAQRSVIEQERNKALAELDRLTKALEEHKKSIADLEEEARRANVPPGWLR
jgi:hypothetical protein